MVITFNNNEFTSPALLTEINSSTILVEFSIDHTVHKQIGGVEMAPSFGQLLPTYLLATTAQKKNVSTNKQTRPVLPPR